ncbi:MAG: hypothetical protein IPQ08_06240 [Chitinophagaceae bacterium]|nr:hypothetical protein [Chitinophagaceae bacterium]
MGLDTTTNFDIVNAQNSKEPVIILQVEGVPYVYSSATVFTKVRYDDPGVIYDGTYVYDGLRPLDSDKQKNYIDRKGSKATISQKLEQWDGKASIETMNIKLIDKNGLITQLITPGIIVDEILNKKVKVYWGYKNLSYPDDYLKIFTGYINQIDSTPGAYNFSFTDPSSKRKSTIFNAATTKLSGSISNVDTTINMDSNTQLYRTILNGLGLNDMSVSIGFIVGDEIITYTNSDCVSQTQIINCVRGSLGSAAASHSIGDEVLPFIHFQDNPVNIALKVMLSGWNGPFVSNIVLRGINNIDSLGAIPDTITFSQGVDLIRDYGLNIGDFVTLSGSLNAPNNATFTITDFLNENRTVLVQQTGILIQENPPIITTVAAFRSKYDVYPTSAGLSLTTDDVSVSRHEYLRDTFIPIVFKMSAKESESSAKTWIETHLFKPVGAYALTQGSRISMGVTHPPLTDDLSKKIDQHTVVNPKTITVSRGLNSRFFYNEVLFHYAYNVVSDTFNRQLRFIDADAQNRMKQVSVLEIEVRGLDDSANSVTVLTQRAERILQRYHYSAETVSISCFFSVGNTIDAGDIVVLSDDPNNLVLQIPNTETGERGIVNRIMEVQERSKDLSSGTCKLNLLSNNGFSFSDRYAVIGPASFVDGTGINTTTRFKIRDFTFTSFPTVEYKKWAPYNGTRIIVHDVNYTTQSIARFSVDDSNPYYFNLETPLSFVPTDGMIVEFAPYDEASSASDSLVKATFAYRCPVGTILSGSSSNVFTVSVPDAAKFQSAETVYVMSPDGSRFSPDVKILSIVGGIITIGSLFSWSTNSNLGFTPLAGDVVMLGGFKDGGSGYRLI